MATNTRKLSDFLAEGSGDTFGDLAVVGEPHIKPGTLYPAYKGLLTDNTGAHTITDSSTVGRVISSIGETHHNGAQEKIGSTSLKFDGAGDYLTVPDHADWDIGSGAWTVEFWVKFSAASISAGNAALFQHRDGSGTGSNYNLRIFQDSATTFSLTGNVSNTSADFAWTPASNTWYHVAVVRDANVAKLFVNGTQTGGNQALTGTYGAVGGLLYIGRIDASNYLNGFLDDIRITKGLAVYTGNFTAPTSALTTTWSAATGIAANSTASNVKLLIHSDAGGHSGAFGTAQSDGLKYYYTDIKGSKPIKDPRIGAHFGSQRHPTTSVQLQEQETAQHGANVYRVDGREWFRAVGDNIAIYNNANGLSVGLNSPDNFWEITFYGIDLNWKLSMHNTNRGFTFAVDGGTASAEQTQGETSVSGDHDPFFGRYLDAHHLRNIGVGATLGIHTVKITPHSGGGVNEIACTAMETITQDTTSTATKSKIQIPAQNVVSYGKKFSVSAAAHHYDPFNGFTNGTTLHSAVVDTATSLGLSSAPGSSASWAISGSNNIRPYNGGRVVKWVDSSGVIKTSVNMMPPNAQNVGTNAAAEITTPSATNTAYLPAFSDDAIDHSLAEVAKTFHVREFGNGAANGGTGATWADASMLIADSSTFDDIAYVMDDGLTSLSADDYGFTNNADNNGFGGQGNGDIYHLTFIGTGISFEATPSSDGDQHQTLAQNLPYGTHILKYERVSTEANSPFDIDGVEIHQAWIKPREFTFHQPKKPPIPDDAIVLADYMLMADFVVQTAGEEHISKGVRMQSHSRDIFVDAVGTTGLRLSNEANAAIPMGLVFDNDGVLTGGGASRSVTQKLPYFGTDFLINHYANRIGTVTENLNSDAGTSTAISTSGNDGLTKHIGNVLGVNEMKAHITNGQNDDRAYTWASFYHTPIHTSSHYQTFETPFLHELVGGDRNMEQTNLVVTADGKTWDEVTRDTSYIGNTILQITRDGGDITSTADFIFDFLRGTKIGTNCIEKEEFVYAYDRVICLKDGEYHVEWNAIARTGNATAGASNLKLNGSDVRILEFGPANGRGQINLSNTMNLKRGDYISITGDDLEGNQYAFLCYLIVTKV